MPMKHRRMLYIDFETRSEKQLRGKFSVGLYNYATDDSTRALMLAWAVDEGEVHVWFPHEEKMPDELYDCLHDPDTDIVSFNSAFERYIFAFVLGITIPARRFRLRWGWRWQRGSRAMINVRLPSSAMVR